MDWSRYRRIAVVGNCGSGKSTFAKELGRRLHLPVIHLDREYWNPGWVETPQEEWAAKQQALLSGKEWILDGNYASTLDLRFAAADLVIFLDINRFVCLWSITRRMGKKRSDLPEYLEEPAVFSKDFWEFALWTWNFYKTGKPRILALHQQYFHTPFLRYKSRREMKRVLYEDL